LPAYQPTVIRPAEVSQPAEARLESPTQPAAFQIQPMEKSILTHVVLHPECLNHPKMTELLDFVSQNEVKSLIQRIAKMYLEIEDSEYSSILQQFILSKEFALSLKETISSALFQFKPIKMAPAKLDKFMIDLVKKSKIQKLKNVKTLLIQKQSQTYSQEESNQYMQQIIEIEKNLENIKNQLA
ncbi:MAG: hypothetical protein JNM93_01845, partial [Bacteriovoracaceae bacterium]|nr:hypothetical protein [Bacteriovoracaceae bacterium]